MEQNQTQPIKKYDFGLTKGNFIIFLVIFGGITLLMGYITFSQPNWITGLLTSMSLGFCLAMYFNYRFKRKIIVYEDSINLPIGIWSKKTRTIKIDEIENDIESNNNGIPVINLRIKGEKKPIAIQQTHMDEVEFFEFQDWLLSKIKERPQTHENLIKKEPKFMDKVWVWVAILFMPALLIGSRYLTGNLKEPKDWYTILGLVAFIYLVTYLGSKVQQKNYEDQKELVNKLKDPENKKKRNIWASVIYGWGVASLVGSMFAIRLMPTDGNMTLWPFAYYSLMLTVGVIFLLHKSLPSVEELVGKAGMYTGYVFAGMFMAMGMIFVLGHLNIKLDESEGVERYSGLTGKYENTKNGRKTCYRVAHWETGEEFGEDSFCNDKYPRLKEDDKVRFIAHKGYFDIPWIKDVKFLRYESPNSYLDSFKDISKLRYFDIKMLMDLNGNDFWTSQGSVWESECNSKKWDSCRFMGYLSSASNDKGKASQFFRKGCDNQDFYNCYNAYLMDRDNPETKKYALENTKKLCSETESKEFKTICEYMAK